MQNHILTSLLTWSLVPIVGSGSPSGQEDHFFQLRRKMVEKQIRDRGIHDKKVLDAMLKVKRHLFVPPEEDDRAYEDYPLPIGSGQTISQPYIVAYMTSLLQLEGHEKVLEIGTGCGYQAAVLAEIIPKVYTIEIIPELASCAKKKLQALGYNNIFLRQADGFEGWPEESPYDAILVTAAPAEIPENIVAQLKVGGKLVIPLGSFSQDLCLITKTDTGLVKKSIIPVRFVPMVKGKV